MLNVTTKPGRRIWHRITWVSWITMSMDQRTAYVEQIEKYCDREKLLLERVRPWYLVDSNTGQCWAYWMGWAPR